MCGYLFHAGQQIPQLRGREQQTLDAQTDVHAIVRHLDPCVASVVDAVQQPRVRL
jgi:hypothetical protein